MAGPLLNRRANARRYAPLSEINVTPFVDVMLVLLIVFMVTAPLLTVGVPVDLPKTQAAQLTDEVEPLVVTVMGMVSAAGFTKVALLAELPDPDRAQPAPTAN